MGYAVIMFVILLLLAVSIALSSNYGVSKDSQEAQLLAENAYAERDGGKMQTDLVVTATKINGTAKYTSVTGTPNLLNLYLTIKNNGSIVHYPRDYSIIFNGSWTRIVSTSDNITTPLNSSIISSLNLEVTPDTSPMKSISLTVTAGNGIKTITPTSPLIDKNNLTIYPNPDDRNNWWSLDMTWLPSYGEMWPIDHYTLYYMNTTNINLVYDKNDVAIAFTTDPYRNYHIGQAFPKGGNPKFYIWISATDIHGNEGPPSNTCIATGSGPGNVNCNTG
ncbi:MAG: hypothetical protein Q7J35_19045 [Candidatus Methanoperedens sp.]|nr:hypothetical protein [Candidatus Methanoperedens sp.]